MNSALLSLNLVNNSFVLRCKKVQKALKESNAFSEETAVKLEDTKINAPKKFKNVNKFLIKKGKMKQTEDGRFYLVKPDQK